jgi:hypothetical protein
MVDRAVISGSVAVPRIVVGKQLRPRLRWTCLATLLASLLLPASASAHGIVGRADLPIPAWLFAWTATAVMVISFVALWSLWTRPRLQRPPGRVLLRVPKVVEWLCGGVGIALFAIVAYAGLAGEQNLTSNLAPTFIYVIFWVAVPLASAFVGDFFRPFNPWRAVGRLAGWLLSARLSARGSAGGGRRRGPLLGAYPCTWGRWPAAALLLCFAWVELVLPLPGKDEPRLLAILMLAYGGLQLAGMGAFGVEAWCERADGFGVYFGLMARLSPLSWRDRELRLRPPLSGLCSLEAWPGTAAVLFVLIGSTSFDGFSNGEVWLQFAPPLESDFGHLGLSLAGAIEIVGTAGLLLCVAAVAGLYNLGIYGMRGALRDITAEDHRALSLAFLHTLVPIAFGYMLAHYFSLLILQGQAIGYLVSDPLGRGSDLFGTSNLLVNYNLISFAVIWYVQIAAIVAGHVSGLILSHEQGLIEFKSPEAAVRSQYWMLAIMVGFTCLALWILSAVTTTTG